MDPYAVVHTGGKQYRVKKSDTLRVERIEVEVGKKVELPHVLALSSGESLQIGTPELDGAKVTATVVDHIRGEKVRSFKKKRRKGYTRHVGHRQELTILKVEAIG